MVDSVRKISGGLSNATRDLAATTHQFARFQQLLLISIAIGILALVAGTVALGLTVR